MLIGRRCRILDGVDRVASITHIIGCCELRANRIKTWTEQTYRLVLVKMFISTEWLDLSMVKVKDSILFLKGVFICFEFTFRLSDDDEHLIDLPRQWHQLVANSSLASSTTIFVFFFNLLVWIHRDWKPCKEDLVTNLQYSYGIYNGYHSIKKHFSIK